MSSPIQRELLHNTLETIADEVGAVAARNAYSPFVNQMSGIATAFFAADGRLIAQTRGGEFHCSALRVGLRHLLAETPGAEMSDGDVFLLNDHFRGGIHPTDVMVLRPIFIDGALSFFHASLMIVSDLGGVSAAGLPGNATECFHEGVLFPGVRLFRAGEPNMDIVRTIEVNSRTPERVLGDVNAMVAAGHVAAARFRELARQYGPETLLALVDELIAYAERMTRTAIEAMPDGSYHGSYVVEDDGIVPDKSYWIRVRVDVKGSDICVDLTGTDEQARGAVNSSYSQSLSGVIHALRYYLGPDVPMNEGLYTPITVVLPLGSIVNPRFPAACNIRVGAVQAIIDSIWQGMSSAYPEMAQSPGGTPHSLIAAGRWPDSKDPWVLLTPHFGPGGARSTMDGVDCDPGAMFSGIQGAYGGSLEVLEAEYPLRHEYFRVWPDSGGPGRWRGGAALTKAVTFLAPADLTTRVVDRCRIPPAGLAGGRPGRGGGWIINEGRADEWHPRPKETNLPADAGTTVTMFVSGGGGWGDPFERDADLVIRDIRDGFVTREGAESDYGLIVDPVTWAIDDSPRREPERRQERQRAQAGDV
jgi:N-methylhydantoinase B